MRTFLLLAAMAAMLFSPSALPAPSGPVMFMEGPGFNVLAYPKEACKSVAVAKVLAKHKAPFKIKDMIKARVILPGKVVDACMLVQPENMSGVVVGEDGNGTIVPLFEFVQLTEV